MTIKQRAIKNLAPKISKLLLLTNSHDGTSDTLVDLCVDRGVEVFRWNMDLWNFYEASATISGYSFADNYGRKADSNEDGLLAIWRKPFVKLSQRINQNIEEDFAREQLRVYLRSLSHELCKNHKLKLVDPFLENSFSKLIQLQIADKYFEIPGWRFTTSNFPDTDQKLVLKSIAYPMLSNGMTIFTNFESPRDIRSPYPWLFQDPIVGGYDVTCVFISGKCFWYESEFNRTSEAMDWRKEIQTEKESRWHEIKNLETDQLSIKVYEFMREVGLHYGRLDFIKDSSSIYWFLECNVNGEFGWLDDESKKLHKLFLDAIFDTNSVIIH